MTVALCESFSFSIPSPHCPIVTHTLTILLYIIHFLYHDEHSIADTIIFLKTLQFIISTNHTETSSASSMFVEIRLECAHLRAQKVEVGQRNDEFL